MISFWMNAGYIVRRRDQGRDKRVAAAPERAAEYPPEDQRSQYEGHGEAWECPWQIPRDQRWWEAAKLETGAKWAFTCIIMWSKFITQSSRQLVKEPRRPSRPLSRSRRKGSIASIHVSSLWPRTSMRSTRPSHATAVPRYRLVPYRFCTVLKVIYNEVNCPTSASRRLSWAQRIQRSPIWMESTTTVWLQGSASGPWTTCLEERRRLLPWLCSSQSTGTCGLDRTLVFDCNKAILCQFKMDKG